MKINLALLSAIILAGALLIAGCSSTPVSQPSIPGDSTPAAQPAAPSAPETTAAVAKKGDTVQVTYTGKLSDGSVFDSSEGRDPLQFTLGSNQVIDGFDKAVTGMKVGEKKTFTVPASEAYGPHLDELIIELNNDQLPAGITPAVGQKLQSTQPDGSMIYATIVEVSASKVKVDANHPLAGKDLTFEIVLVKIL